MKPELEFKNESWTQIQHHQVVPSGVRLLCLTALALTLAVPARAETPPAPIPFSELGARATADYHGDALSVTATADGACLRCGFQKLQAHATRQGLWLESTAPGAAGKLRVAASDICRAGPSTLNPVKGRGPHGALRPQPSTTLPATGPVSVEDQRVRFKRPGLTEEYSVSVDGVRQDFIIESPPLNFQRSTLNQSAGDLRVELTLSGARAETAAGGIKLRLEGSGRTLAYSRMRAEDATGRELTARLEVLSSDQLAVIVADANATYPVRIDPTFSDANWVSLGSGVHSPVYALAMSETYLYAGGEFTTAGGVPANHVARWNGSVWSALGQGMGDPDYPWPFVTSLAVSGTNLYVGGAFTTAGEVTAKNIAKWNGSAWSALGSGMNSQVRALAVTGTDLYAAGYFTNAGGVPANYIAKWDGSAWSGFGTGMNDEVAALAVSGTNLYAGGYFTTVDGVTANRIAKWDGSTWSALGSGLNDVVSALAADGAGHLFVGGGFYLAGTNVPSCIAQANLPWVPTILTPPQTQTAEAGAKVDFWVDASGYPAPSYQWFFPGTNALTGLSTNSHLVLTNILFSQSGTYTVVVTNAVGAATSAPVTLNVIAPVARRWVPGVNVRGQAGNLLSLDYRDNFGPTANWQTMATLTLSNASQFYFDLFEPLPPQRFYRAWRLGTPGVIPSLDLHMVPALTLTGNPGSRIRLDGINQFGPIGAWFTLDTVTLTNTSQLYFDVSVIGQPQRLYRLVPVP